MHFISHIYDNLANNSDPAVILDELVKRADYYDHLEKKCKTAEDFQERKNNVIELISSAAIAHQNNNCNVEEYLQSISLLANADEEDEEKQEWLWNPLRLQIKASRKILCHQEQIIRLHRLLRDFIKFAVIRIVH